MQGSGGNDNPRKSSFDKPTKPLSLPLNVSSSPRITPTTSSPPQSPKTSPRSSTSGLDELQARFQRLQQSSFSPPIPSSTIGSLSPMQIPKTSPRSVTLPMDELQSRLQRLRERPSSIPTQPSSTPSDLSPMRVPKTSPRTNTQPEDELMARFQRLRDGPSSMSMQSSSVTKSLSPPQSSKKSLEVGTPPQDDFEARLQRLMQSSSLSPLPSSSMSTQRQSKELDLSMFPSVAKDTVPTSPRELSKMPLPKPSTDYKRISELLQDKEQVIGHFKSLESSLEGGMRLKDALYQKEQQHGFAPQVHRVSGSQGNDEFMGMLGAGLMFKDRGAPHDHGENTHRLQWYAVARDMEVNPQFYSTNKASDLYKGLAERYKKGVKSSFHWMSLFDHDFESRDFRQAESLHSHLKSEERLPLLQKATLAEHTKRRQLGPSLERLRKGPERNEEIARQQSGTLETSRRETLTKLKTSETYQPRVRLEGEQPKSTTVIFAPITKGSGDK